MPAGSIGDSSPGMDCTWSPPARSTGFGSREGCNRLGASDARRPQVLRQQVEQVERLFLDCRCRAILSAESMPTVSVMKTVAMVVIWLAAEGAGPGAPPPEFIRYYPTVQQCEKALGEALEEPGARGIACRCQSARRRLFQTSATG
jgi:hypothetical protein